MTVFHQRHQRICLRTACPAATDNVGENIGRRYPPLSSRRPQLSASLAVVSDKHPERKLGSETAQQLTWVNMSCCRCNRLGREHGGNMCLVRHEVRRAAPGNWVASCSMGVLTTLPKKEAWQARHDVPVSSRMEPVLIFCDSDFLLFLKLLLKFYSCTAVSPDSNAPCQEL